MASDPHVREVGHVADLDGRRVPVGVDYDSVVILGYRLGSAAAEEFAQLYMSACWQAARQAGEMAAEAVPDEVKPTTTVPLECGHSAQVPLDEVNVALAWCSGCQRLRPLTNEVATPEAVPVEVIEPAAQAREDVRGMWNAAFGHDP